MADNKGMRTQLIVLMAALLMTACEAPVAPTTTLQAAAVEEPADTDPGCVFPAMIKNGSDKLNMTSYYECTGVLDAGKVIHVRYFEDGQGKRDAIDLGNIYTQNTFHIDGCRVYAERLDQYVDFVEWQAMTFNSAYYLTGFKEKNLSNGVVTPYSCEFKI